VLKTHVASAHFNYFICFREMLQLFHTDVAKVDQDIVYVIMVIHVCCKCSSKMFHLCFWTYCYKCVYLDVTYVSHIYCKCFYLDMAYVCNGFQVFFMYFYKCFRSMFQVFHLSSDVLCCI
jgi:hypothetical protein